MTLSEDNVRQESSQRNLLLAALFFIIGLFSASNYFSDKQQADASLHWSGTLGKIEWSQVTALKGSQCVPEAGYTYKVDGKEFKNTVICFPSPKYSNHADAEAFIAKFSVNREVPVSYDPKDPSHACLIPGETGFINAPIPMILIQFGASIICLFLPAGAFSRRRIYGASNALNMIQPSSKSRRS